MEQIQTVGVLLCILLLGACCAWWAWAVDKDRKDRAAEAVEPEAELPDVMTSDQAVARHLFGEAYDWDAHAMLAYDTRASVRAPWEAEARWRTVQGGTRTA